MRVFPRQTNATPIDDLVRINEPPGLFDSKIDIDQVHISVAFTWDLPRAEWLVYQWERIAPVKIGGPACGQRSEKFVAGRYLKSGYTIISRGCPNKCWFCDVWRREGPVRELPIVEGYNILDDNLLACSDDHIRAVFDMLKKQKMGRPKFAGGLEAARLKPWHVEALVDLKPEQIFLAYDRPESLEPLQSAARMLVDAGFNRQTLRAFVLCGYKKDTLAAAEARMIQVLNIGFFPQSMLYRDKKNSKLTKEWQLFHREWSRPAMIYSKMKAMKKIIRDR